MTRSGLGDLLSTFTAAADWRLASIVGFDSSYSPTAVAVLRTGIDRAVAAAGALRSNDPDGAPAAGRRADPRRPGDGDRRPHLAVVRAPSTPSATCWRCTPTPSTGGPPPHGAQVGAATVVVARVWAAMRRRLPGRPVRRRAARRGPAAGAGRAPRSGRSTRRVRSRPSAGRPTSASSAGSTRTWPRSAAVCESWADHDAGARASCSPSRPRSKAPCARPAHPPPSASSTRRPDADADPLGGRQLPPDARPVHRGRPGRGHRLVDRRRTSTIALAGTAMTGGDRGRAPVRRPPHRFDGYAFDLDGTVYLDDQLLPGAAETIAALRGPRRGRGVRDQQAAEPAEAYAAKLTRLGIPATRADVVTALDSLRPLPGREHPGARLLTIAEPLVDQTCAEAGFTGRDRPRAGRGRRRVVRPRLQLRQAARGLPGGPPGRRHRRHQPGSVLPDGRRRAARLRGDAGRARGLHRPPGRGGRRQAEPLDGGRPARAARRAAGAGGDGRRPGGHRRRDGPAARHGRRPRAVRRDHRRPTWPPPTIRPDYVIDHLPDLLPDEPRPPNPPEEAR